MTETDPLSSDELALQRTLMASERTFMAWTRTALSLISFGFAIPKVLEQTEQVQRHLLGDRGPRLLGIVLIGLGVFVLAVASFQHGNMVRGMRKQKRTQFTTNRLSYVVAIVLFLLGALALLNIAFHMGPL